MASFSGAIAACMASHPAPPMRVRLRNQGRWICTQSRNGTREHLRHARSAETVQTKASACVRLTGHGPKGYMDSQGACQQGTKIALAAALVSGTLLTAWRGPGLQFCSASPTKRQDKQTE
eukprot:1137581-Pelagomonas_calceolata.AAC.1